MSCSKSYYMSSEYAKKPDYGFDPRDQMTPLPYHKNPPTGPGGIYCPHPQSGHNIPAGCPTSCTHSCHGGTASYKNGKLICEKVNNTLYHE